jgi:hypothetical protein
LDSRNKVKERLGLPEIKILEKKHEETHNANAKGIHREYLIYDCI